MDLSLEEAAIITKAVQDPEWCLGKQSELITEHQPLIKRLREAGYLQQNADEFSLNANGYSKFKHLAAKSV